MRIALAALCAMALAAATVFVAKTEQSITAQRAAVRAFDLHAREATDALAELRTAQQAYVAVGQGPDFWMSKVDATRQTIGTTLTMLWQSAASAGSKSALDEAAVPAVSDTRGDDLALRRTDEPENKPTEGVLPTRLIEPARSVAALKAAAELCTDIGRVNNLEELKALLGRSAELLEASGLVL